MNSNEEFFLDVNSKANGIYLSQQQIDLLMITDLSSKEEIRNYVEKLCTQFPNQIVEEIIPSFDTLDLETCKRNLFESYQQTLVGYLENANMTPLQQAEIKLNRMGISEEEKNITMGFIEKGKISEAYNYLRQTKGNDFIVQFNRVMKGDFENVKSVDYDYMQALNQRIKNDNSIDTIIIATGKFDNSVYSNGQSKYFDPLLTMKGLEYCKRTGKHMRYHALFDYAHLTKLIKEGKSIKDREEILTEMKIFVQQSFDFIKSQNDRMLDGSMRINVVEIFNELVEYNKNSNERDNYQMAWEKYFGITMDDLVSCFDNVEKIDGVEFMYNETMLEESPVRRAKVEEVYATILSKRPDLIDKFGNQMHLEHLHGTQKSGNNKRGIEEVAETFDLMKKIETGFSFTDKQGVVHQIPPRHTEITEFDIHIERTTMTNKVVPMLQNGQLTNEQILNMKKSWIQNISKLAKEKGLHFDRTTYWSVTDTVDHNLCRANVAIQEENKKRGTNVPPLKNMYAGLFGSSKPKLVIQVQKDEVQKKSFDQRTVGEIQIAQQIRTKNQMIAQEKQHQKQQSKPKTLVKTNYNSSSSSKGYVNTVILSLIISFFAGMLFMIVYFIVR